MLYPDEQKYMDCTMAKNASQENNVQKCFFEHWAQRARKIGEEQKV